MFEKSPCMRTQGISGSGSKHYNIFKLGDTNEEKWQCLLDIFANGANELNMLIGSTSGVHGSDSTLDSIEKYWNITDEEDENYYGKNFSVLIIHPRLVCMVYDHIEIRSMADLRWLQDIITQSVGYFIESQKLNIDKEFRDTLLETSYAIARRDA